MNFKEKLGVKLKYFRIKKGLSVEQMTNKLKLNSVRTYINYENGVNEPSLLTTMKILKTFNIKFEELVDFSNLQEVKKRTPHHLIYGLGFLD